MPDSMIATISSVVATGRRMNGRDGLIVSARPVWARPASGRLASARRPGAVAVLPPPALSPSGAAVAAAGPSPPASARTMTLAPSRSLSAPSITTRSPGCRPESTSTRSPSVTPSLTGRTVTVLSSPTQVDEGAGHAALDAGGRHRHHVLVRVDQQPDVDELVRKERPCFVGELGAQLDRAGGRVDLVVERRERAVGELAGAGAVERGDGKRRAGTAGASRWPADCPRAR